MVVFTRLGLNLCYATVDGNNTLENRKSNSCGIKCTLVPFGFVLGIRQNSEVRPFCLLCSYLKAKVKTNVLVNINGQPSLPTDGFLPAFWARKKILPKE